MSSYEYNFLGLNKTYGSRTVIHDARIKIIEGRCTLLIGENGTGKSTMLKMISGLEKPDAGLIRIDGETRNWRRSRASLLKHILYLHQHPFMFEGSVRKNLEFTRRFCGDCNTRVDEAIAWAGLEAIIDENAKTLSGGEMQRVALARAYLRAPHVILLDEPTANLDQPSKLKTLELLNAFKEQGIALIIASHDPDIFSAIQDERLQLQNAKLTNLVPRKKSPRVTELHPFRTRNG